MDSHQRYMYRALQLAKNGIGTSRPNPSVGCVIVNQQRIIGEGFTSPSGGAHAEVNAICSVKDHSLLKNSILYVTLEPCNHHGKTPPCTKLIVQKQVGTVVIGIKDPNPMVAGKGIDFLKNNGVNVICDVLAESCKQQHKRFLTFQIKKRPFILLKWAQTLDGFITPLTTKRKNKTPVWISNSYAKQLAHNGVPKNRLFWWELTQLDLISPA